MAQLLVRELEDDVAGGLRRLAAANKRSVEEEHRAALRAHVRDRLTGPPWLEHDLLGNYS